MNCGSVDIDGATSCLRRLDDVIDWHRRTDAGWGSIRLCDELSVVVDLQRLALVDRDTYRAALGGREPMIGLWLYQLALHAGSQGWPDFAPTLLHALPDVDCTGFERALSEALGRTSSSHVRAVGGVR